ncbi:hypothetical protein ACWDOP_33125 [Nocardia sp. NPDC003693]
MSSYARCDISFVLDGSLATISSVAKDGREHDENEDRVAAGLRRVAIADGASTSARPEVWAEILVHTFVNDAKDPFEPQVLSELRQR